MAGLATEAAAMSETSRANSEKLNLIRKIINEADQKWHRGEYVSLRVILSRLKKILETED